MEQGTCRYVTFLACWRLFYPYLKISQTIRESTRSRVTFSLWSSTTLSLVCPCCQRGSCLTLVKMNCWFLLRRSPSLVQAHWLQVMALYKSFQVSQFPGLFWVNSIRILLGFYFGFHFYIFWRAFNWTIFINSFIRILGRECIIN